MLRQDLGGFVWTGITGFGIFAEQMFINPLRDIISTFTTTHTHT